MPSRTNRLKPPHPRLLADLRQAKEMVREQAQTQGYSPHAPQHPNSNPNAHPKPQPQPHPGGQTHLSAGAGVGYAANIEHPVPAASDTAPFGMLGGDPDWDNQWHTFMDQLGMYAADPNVPYAPPQQQQQHSHSHSHGHTGHPHHGMHMQPKMER
ncbi:hypothetical protein M422DRAFT_250414 [Sphaerobolus stellatus SS14]|uniref:Uncharacterized protein n=1 Tax=Sphaerobolus stellatus (strain SS14) TaxID=990650 RepID=A0A0C9W415_SPHS4|nr:hypothetical protein M422DRAFT_250414 [Sphaerobolus stellatus SS14]